MLGNQNIYLWALDNNSETLGSTCCESVKKINPFSHLYLINIPWNKISEFSTNLLKSISHAEWCKSVSSALETAKDEEVGEHRQMAQLSSESEVYHIVLGLMLWIQNQYFCLSTLNCLFQRYMHMQHWSTTDIAGRTNLETEEFTAKELVGVCAFKL